jgi:hypothetical protein
MVDTSDFVVAYCPTNIYSVGTPHEIVVARQQRKPVLFVSPPVRFPEIEELRSRLRGDAKSLALLDRLGERVPIKENPRGNPSLWYMPLVGSENFFDGFGFDEFRSQFDWSTSAPDDERELRRPPERPLLRFLNEIADGKLPQKWDRRLKQFVPNDDWLLFEHALEGRKGP